MHPLNMERVEILIDPDTLEYQVDLHSCNLGHIYTVLKSFVERIEAGDFGENVVVTEEDSGRELNPDEIRDYISTGTADDEDPLD
jgi:hypothetical protein